MTRSSGYEKHHHFDTYNAGKNKRDASTAFGTVALGEVAALASHSTDPRLFGLVAAIPVATALFRTADRQITYEDGIDKHDWQNARGIRSDFILAAEITGAAHLLNPEHAMMVGIAMGLGFVGKTLSREFGHQVMKHRRDTYSTPFSHKHIVTSTEGNHGKLLRIPKKA